MRIRTRLVLMLTPVVVLLLVFLEVYSQINARSEAWEKAQAMAEAIAHEYSSGVQMQMVIGRGYAEALASAGQCMYDSGQSRETLNGIVKSAVASERSILGMGLLFDDFDGKNASNTASDTGNASGRYGGYYAHSGSGLEFSQLDFEKENYYLGVKQAGKTALTEPFYDPVNKLLMVSLTAPVFQKGQVVGGAVADMSLSGISTLLAKVRPFETGYAFVVSDKGVVVGHYNPENQGKTITEVSSASPEELNAGLAGKATFTTINKSVVDGTEVMAVYVPFTFLEGHAPWYFAVAVPVSTILAGANSELYQSVAICFVGIILAVVVIFLISSSIARPLSVMAAFAGSVARGNYDEKVDTTGFTAELHALNTALQDMIDSLLKTMREANDSKLAAEEGLAKAQAASEEANKAQQAAEEGRQKLLHTAEQVEELVGRLSTATEELSAQVEQSSVSVNQQRELVMNAAAAMEEMNSTVLEVARNASDASTGSEKAKNAANDGALVVKQSIDAIGSVQTDISSLHKEMEELGTQAQSIGNIMTVISDIADQTNLLALNAAIEAARAGDAGRGFAVVADEVRKLAEKTMTATQEVGKAITGVQQGTQRSISAVSQTVAHLDDTTGLVDQSGLSLQNIVHESELVADQISGIATAAEEQSATSAEISTSLSNISSSADETATAMEHSAQAVSELARQTASLQEIVHKLRE
ncbi:methyl-accepting chemotaxis protein [Desulfovibrio sp. OttesenSCG-928-O18]|nr:methyl-accepting chemotaxis protein [Desulfovibrio sp. OttesenSCG-928-O18]